MGSQFELDPSNLVANKTYKVFFDLGAVSAEYNFITDMITSGGWCEVTPPEGQVIDTPFKIVCSNWKDDDSPLSYEFFFVHPEAGVKLLCYGWESYCTDLALPSGSPERNYTVELLAKITDMLGSFKTVSLKVKVSLLTLTLAHNLLVNMVETIRRTCLKPVISCLKTRKNSGLA